MKKYVKTLFKHFDYGLFITYLVLALFGLLMIYSSSMLIAMNRFDPPRPPNYFFMQQLKYVLLGVPLFFMMSFIPYKLFKLKPVIVLMLGTMFGFLILVHFIGAGSSVGAQSWIRLRFFNIQPSELAKLTMILYLSAVFANKFVEEKNNTFTQDIVPPMIVMLAVAFLVLTEPDLGATMIIVFVSLAVLVVSGVTKEMYKKMFSVFFITIIPMLLFILWKKDTIMTESRLGRFTAYADPFKYESGSGKQIVNGFIAIGSGGLKGLGLGNSVQKMGYLPEPHTDVIIAIISEELGLFGTTIVLGGLFLIVYKAMKVAFVSKDPHSRMLAVGIGSLFAIQTFINVGGLTGLIPLTGVTLPFISFGGTSFVLKSIALGILMNIIMFTKHQEMKEGA